MEMAKAAAAPEYENEDRAESGDDADRGLSQGVMQTEDAIALSTGGVIAGTGVVAKRDLPRGSVIQTTFCLVPNTMCILQCAQLLQEFCLSSPLTLFVASMEQDRRNQIMLQYSGRAQLTEEVRRELAILWDRILVRLGRCSFQELESVAQMVVCYNIAANREIELEGIRFPNLVGCMGQFVCHMNHPEIGNASNVKVSNTAICRYRPDFPELDPGSGRYVLHCFLHIQSDMRQGDELTFDYGVAAKYLN
jgi:hypothetical protein